MLRQPRSSKKAVYHHIRIVYLNVVALMVVATISEETVVDDRVNVELVKKRVAILDL